MRLTHFTRGTLGLLAASGIAWGCTSKSSDCSANKDCADYDGGAPGVSGASGSSGKSGASGGSGKSGGAGVGNEGGSAGDEGGASGVGASAGTSGTAGSGGAPCVGTSAPDTAQCVIGDGFGLFVSLSGNDTSGDGSEAKPLATVTKALSLTGPGKINRVYVCSTPSGSATSYAEPDTLTIPDRVSIYGGFTCDGGVWAYDATAKAWLKPASPVGAIVNNAQNGVTVQDLRIDATNAPEDGTGASSFGMIVKGSKAVTLTRVEIRAGKGGKGGDGANGLTGPDGMTSSADQNGKIATCSGNAQDGGSALSPICVSQGGKGGAASIGAAVGTDEDGHSGFPNYSTNKGVATAATLTGGTGVSGTVGAAGSAAVPVGSFSATGFMPASGGTGVPGTPGQGGGGGAAAAGSATCVGASGGAGGMGGCGGDAGAGGIGGGASVALSVWSSVVSIDTCTLVSGSAGAGGNGGLGHIGGLGQAGGTGGPGLPAKSLAAAGDGGKGGPGGNGGNGAGGSGGPSISLVFNGTKPTETNVTSMHAGTAASPGTGGQLGATKDWGSDGQPGAILDEYEQK